MPTTFATTKKQYAYFSHSFFAANQLKEVQSFRDTKILPFIKNHERFLAANGSNGHYVGEKVNLKTYSSFTNEEKNSGWAKFTQHWIQITIADIAAYQTLNWVFNTPFASLFNKNDTPNIFKVYETVAADPKIKEYVESGRRFAPYSGWQIKVDGQVELQEMQVSHS